jgi:2',3'-cyclic-nucleotide 2'-phosphodiesterase (5'-nucleotidase family)
VVVIGVVDRTPPGDSGRTVAQVRVGDPAAAITRALPTVLAENPDAVLVLGDFDASCTGPGCGGEAVGLARVLGDGAVQAIVGGTAAATVGGTTVAPVLAYGVGLTVVDLVHLAVGGKTARARVDTVWADRVSPDSAVAGIVRREMEALDRTLDQPVAGCASLLGDSTANCARATRRRCGAGAGRAARDHSAP